MKERDKVREKNEENAHIWIRRLLINSLEYFPTHDNTYYGTQNGIGKQIQVKQNCAYSSLYTFGFPYFNVNSPVLYLKPKG